MDICTLKKDLSIFSDNNLSSGYFLLLIDNTDSLKLPTLSNINDNDIIITALKKELRERIKNKITGV